MTTCVQRAEFSTRLRNRIEADSTVWDFTHAQRSEKKKVW